MWNLKDFKIHAKTVGYKNKLVREKRRDKSAWKLLAPGYGLQRRSDNRNQNTDFH